MVGRDIYGPEDGPRKEAASLEEVIEIFRDAYPGMNVEGSTGMMRSFFLNGSPIGSTWERRDGTWFYRMRKHEDL